MATTAHVTTLPNCDICKYECSGQVREAQYDARTNDGRWGNVCEEHFQTHTSGKLGTGFGQRLTTEPKTEPSREEIGAAIDDAIKRGDLSAIEEIIGDGDIAEWL